MSLTRDEWITMWESVKHMESLARTLKPSKRRNFMLFEIGKMKELIQSVIGQME